jgi:hypothetical protein
MTEREQFILKVLERINNMKNPTWEDQTEKYYLEKELEKIRQKG